MNHCARIGRVFGGCRFEARYDYGAPTILKTAAPIVDSVCDQIEASKPRTYVRDVCVSCGKTIERPDRAR